MSVRSAEGTGADGADMGERRAAPGQRVHFEALVAVGEARGGGFEAESVDVSPDGMRLRAAYLPEVGDKLVCRFDGAGAEVVAEGEVTWRNPEARGGEFGLRFAGLDAVAQEAIRGVCAALTSEAAPKEKGEPSVSRGARVRLHIDGLGSPMKARVRESATREVEVGSNLEFLKVGRPLEIEDVDKSKRREAWIESVKVDVDPATRVPQLVVALRYDEAAGAPDKAQAKRPSARPQAKPSASIGSEARPAGDKAEPRFASDKDARAVSGKDKSSAPFTATKEQGASRVDDDGETPESEGADDEGVGARAARAGRAVAGKIAPALADVGARARGAMGGLLAAVQRRRGTAGEAEVSAAPRRTTAPPPGGALKTEGRRLVREDGSAIEEAEVAPPPRMSMNRSAAAMGGALGLVAVLAVVGGTRFMAARGAASAAGTATAITAPGAEPGAGERVDGSASPAAAGALPSMALPQGAASGTPVANVPLFGATPLSTTEAVPPPPSPSASALAGAPPPAGGADEPTAGDDEAGPGEKSSGGAREWGQGSVQHPVTLKLKMDGPVERINGAAGAMGFTLSLPDRRALSTSQDLTHKDKRLASVNVINTSHGAEVTVQFKDGVPAYLARGKGDRLEILLGSEGHKKVAKKKKGDEPSKSKASKKKAHK